jgi:hypothetical protein
MSADAIAGIHIAIAIARQRGVQPFRLFVMTTGELCMICSILALCHFQLMGVFYDAFHKRSG